MRFAFGTLGSLALLVALQASADGPPAAFVAPLPPVELARLLVAGAEVERDPVLAARARAMLLGLDPRDAAAELLLARACLASLPQDLGRAREAVEHAQRKAAASGEATRLQALIADALGDARLARTLLERSVSEGVADELVLLELSAAVREAGESQRSLELLERAAALAPASAEPLQRLAAEQARGGDAVRARRTLDEALTRDPGHLGARLARARLPSAAEHGGDTDLAVHDLLVRNDEQLRRPASDAVARERLAIATRLTELEPGEGRWRLQQAELLAGMGRTPDAVKSLDAAASSLDRASDLALGALLAHTWGDFERGIALAQRALAAARARPDATAEAQAHRALGACLLHGGRSGEAVAPLQRALSRLGHRSDLRTLIAEALLAAGQRDQATRELRVAVQLDPGNVRALTNLGALLRESGAQVESQALLEEARRRAPDDAAAHANLGLLLHDLGRTEEALAALTSAARAAPSDRLIRYSLGALLVANARHAEAVPHLEAALAADGTGGPAPPEARRLLDMARRRSTEAAPHP